MKARRRLKAYGWPSKNRALPPSMIPCSSSARWAARRRHPIHSRLRRGPRAGSRRSGRGSGAPSTATPARAISCRSIRLSTIRRARLSRASRRSIVSSVRPSQREVNASQAADWTVSVSMVNRGEAPLAIDAPAAGDLAFSLEGTRRYRLFRYRARHARLGIERLLPRAGELRIR